MRALQIRRPLRESPSRMRWPRGGEAGARQDFLLGGTTLYYVCTGSLWRPCHRAAAVRYLASGSLSRPEIARRLSSTYSTKQLIVGRSSITRGCRGDIRSNPRAMHCGPLLARHVRCTTTSHPQPTSMSPRSMATDGPGAVKTLHPRRIASFPTHLPVRLYRDRAARRDRWAGRVEAARCLWTHPTRRRALSPTLDSST